MVVALPLAASVTPEIEIAYLAITGFLVVVPLLFALIAILLIFALASFDEYHQSFVDGRTSDFKDIIIDSIGGTCGILFYGTYYFVYKLGYKKGIDCKK